MKNELFLLVLNRKNRQYGLTCWIYLLRQIIRTGEYRCNPILYYFTGVYCTLHTLEKCFSWLNVLHTAQRYKCKMQAEVRHISANIKTLEQICKLLNNNHSNLQTWCKKIFIHNNFILIIYMLRALCAHHQQIKFLLYSIWCHESYRWPSGSEVEMGLCTGRLSTGVMIPDAV